MPEEQEDLRRFEELFRHNYPRLCQRVYRITHDMEAAEDIVQEVFVNFWEVPNCKLLRFLKPIFIKLF